MANGSPWSMSETREANKGKRIARTDNISKAVSSDLIKIQYGFILRERLLNQLIQINTYLAKCYPSLRADSDMIVLLFRGQAQGLRLKERTSLRSTWDPPGNWPEVPTYPGM